MTSPAGTLSRSQTVSQPEPPPDLDRLGERIVGLSGRIAAATCRWLLLVATFDRHEGYARSGLASTASWLAHTCGIAHRTAVDHVRVARALSAFPRLASALESGRISYSHVRAISRLARAGEHQLIDDLVGVAEHGTVGQLETMVRGLRTVDDNADEDESGAPASGEYVRHGWASRTSHWRVSARLDPERGAAVEHAIAMVAKAEGITHADALVRLAEIALSALEHRTDGPPRTPRGHERSAVVIHLDASAVTSEPRSRERGESRPFARIEDGPGLPRRVVERLLCACRIRVAVFDGANVLDVGRTKRVVDERLLRALLLRDRHCTFPGCTSKHKLEAHHVVHWIRGGRTDMANLVMLCERHHHAHHDGEFEIARFGSPRDGGFVFRRPDSVVLEHHVDTGRVVSPDAPPIETYFDALPDSAIRSRSIGDRLDRAWAIAVLAQRRRDAADPRPGISGVHHPDVADAA